LRLASLAAAGFETALVGRANQPSGCASVSVDSRGENAIAVAPGANLELTADALPPDLLTPQTTVLLQMEVAPEANWRVLRRARAAGARTVLNVAPAGEVPQDALQLVDVLIVNRGELAVISGGAGDDANIRERATSLAQRHGLICIVTLGGDGVCAVDGNGARALEAFPVGVIDTVGAGDTFAGVLAAALDRGETLDQALRRATVAAALACTRPGAQPSIPDSLATADALVRDTRSLRAL
jgi:ribokinase